MSAGILEVRSVLHADGTQTRMYRIGTNDWVDLTNFSMKTYVEHPATGEYQVVA